jgi:hypothetical protein
MCAPSTRQPQKIPISAITGGAETLMPRRRGEKNYLQKALAKREV